MAMTGAGMRDAVANALGTTDAASLAQIGKITAAIVTYIQAHAVVSTTDTVPATGIVAPNGACTGAASGTGSGTVA